MSTTALAAAPVRLQARAGGLPLGAIFGGLGLLGAAAVRLLHLDHLGIGLCVFKTVTGLPCVGCGGTRAVGLLAHLDLQGALAMNPLVTVAALLLVPWGLIDGVLLLRGRALDVDVSPLVAACLRVGAVTAVALNWAYLLHVGR